MIKCGKIITMAFWTSLQVLQSLSQHVCHRVAAYSVFDVDWVVFTCMCCHYHWELCQSWFEFPAFLINTMSRTLGVFQMSMPLKAVSIPAQCIDLLSIIVAELAKTVCVLISLYAGMPRIEHACNLPCPGV